MHIPNHTLELTLVDHRTYGSWQEFDAWVQRHFQVVMPHTPLETRYTGPQSRIDQARAVCELALRTLVLAAAWQRAANLPVHVPGLISVCVADETKPGTWRVQLQVVHLRYLPDTLLHKVYTYAAAFCRKADQLPQSAQAIQALYAELQNDIITPLTHAMPLGKSTRHLLKTAQDRNLPWQHVGNGVFQLGWGSQSTRFRHSSLWRDSGIGTDTAQNKYWAAQWLTNAGLPAPEQRVVNNADQAVNAANSLSGAVVVKPIDRDRGEGVCTNIASEADIRRAFEAAQAFSAQVLVERKVPGVCHRVLVVKGQLVYVVKRMPPAVQGNGSDTIRLLCERMNTERMVPAPWLRQPLLPTDAETEITLAHQGLTLDSILSAGAWAALRPIESTQWGGIDHDFTDTIHPQNAALAIEAARIFGLECAGVDILSPDIRAPWFSNGAVINEVNSAPTLGGGPVALRTLGKVLHLLMPGNGRIPIHVFIGNTQAWREALACYRALNEKGLRCLLVGEQETLSPAGTPRPLAHAGIYERVHSLLLHPFTDALVIHDPANGLLPATLPFDQLRHLAHVVDTVGESTPSQEFSQKAQLARLAALTPLLRTGSASY